MKKTILVLLSLLCLLSVVPNVNAQTVYNPTVIQFNSLDHSIACPADKCVSSYKVEYWLQGVDPATGQPVSTYTLAKAKVVASGITDPAWQANLADLTPIPAIPVGSNYVARVIAVGLDAATLSARSAASNPFASAGAPRSLTNVLLK
jgi:hypothetical protein